MTIRARLGRGARRRLSMGLQRALARLEPERSVVVTEYQIHPRSMWGWEGRPVNPWLAAVLEESMPGVRALAAELNQMAEWCQQVPPRAPEPGTLAWDNPYWGSIDAVMQVHALRARRSRTYLEVGSGYSTLFARRAIDDFGLPTRIISIDPSPRREMSALCDQVISKPFEDVVDEALALLEPGDVFVFDGSHLATMGSDATVLFTGPLAMIPPGVLVGIDDIFLPSDYHPTWASRWYGEQYLLAAWLMGGHVGWEITLPSWHATDPNHGEDLFAPLWPAIEARGSRRGTALWMERREDR